MASPSPDGHLDSIKGHVPQGAVRSFILGPQSATRKLSAVVRSSPISFPPDAAAAHGRLPQLELQSDALADTHLDLKLLRPLRRSAGTVTARHVLRRPAQKQHQVTGITAGLV